MVEGRMTASRGSLLGEIRRIQALLGILPGVPGQVPFIPIPPPPSVLTIVPSPTTAGVLLVSGPGLVDLGTGIVSFTPDSTVTADDTAVPGILEVTLP
jgi:hypothetical protein